MMIDIFVITFVVLQVLDYLTTIEGMKRGFSEGNPLLAKLFKRTRPEISLAAVKLATCAVVLVLIMVDAVHLYAMVIICVAYLAIVANNFYRLRSQPKE